MILAGMFGGSASLEARVQRLFNGGVPGVMIDPTRMEYCYQDSARTTLVNALGQPIGSPTDLSGNGKHPAQATPTSRPLFQNAAVFDGADDGWQTPAIDFTGTDKMTVVAAARKSASADGMIVELSPQFNLNNGAFNLLSRADPTGITLFIRGNASTVAVSDSAFSVGAAAVVTAKTQIASEWAHSISVNADTPTFATTNVGTGNFGNYALNIGARNASSLFFNGRIYRLLIIGRALTAAEINIAERWANQPVGVLP